MVGIGDTASVADQSAGRRELAPVRDCRHAVANSDCGEFCGLALVEWVAAG